MVVEDTGETSVARRGVSGGTSSHASSGCSDMKWTSTASVLSRKSFNLGPGCLRGPKMTFVFEGGLTIETPLDNLELLALTFLALAIILR